jgi:hypothetical protein
MKTLLAIAVAAMMAGAPSLAASVPQQAAAGQTAEAAGLKDFADAIKRYMTLRQKVRSEVPGPVKNSSSAQLTNASDALAGAIERSRQGAHVGSIFNRPVTTVIKHRIAEALRVEKASVLDDIDDEGQSGPSPKIHLRLPVSTPMATMPPSLLSVLPPLPKELEYRILGRYLVLRDVDASLVLDYIPGAVPR